MRTITILLIEDNLPDERLIRETLKDVSNFTSNLISVVTLKDGCEQIQKNNFDIILLDLNLPDSTGRQTFQKVIDCNNEIPVVLITGMEDVKLSLKLIMEGAQDYITKQSLNPDLLEKSILYSIERQKLLKNIKTQNVQIDRIEKERILLAKFPSQDPAPILRVAGNGKLLYINEAGTKLLPDWQLIINEIIPSRLKDIIDPIFIEGTNIRFELCHREFIYSFSAVPLIEDGYINLYGRDITERKRAEESLVKMGKAIYTSGEAIFLTDREGIFTFVNPAFTSLYGFSSDEVIGKVTPRIIKSGVLDKSVYEGFWQTLLNGDEVRGELINKRKDGTTINIEGFATPFIDEEKNIIGFLGSQRDITERKQAEEALNNSQQELRKFATHLQHVREEEKIALAREIHDDLGQILVALKINLGLFKKKISKGIEVISSEEILSEFDQLSNLVDNTIKTTRRIMNGLRPELIELLGFEAACKSYLHDFDETHHISSQFESTILNLNINLERSVALFRILQEALNNIIKHAKATLVTVQLSNPAGKLVMVIVDNGVGFDENNKGRQDSYGLIGMKERVFLLEGELNITSKVGKGTSVRVEIPYSDTISDAEQLEIEY